MSYLLNVREKLKYFKDVADLTTTILIIAGLSLSAIVAIGGIAYSTRDNAQTSAECISNYSAFNTTTNIDDNCKGSRNDGEENSDDGENQPPIGDNPDDEELIPTPDNCFLLNEIGDTIVKYKIEVEGCSTDVVIPGEIDGVEIKHIGDMAFMNEKGTTVEEVSFGIASVVFTDEIESIGTGAFYYSNLTVIELPQNIKSIGSMAFSENNISNLYIPDSVESIGSEAFYNNPLKSLRITENVNYTQIAKGTFRYFCTGVGGCTGKVNTSGINHLEIPDNIKIINDNGFSGMKIETLNMSNSVNTIGNSAFKHSNISQLNLSSNLKTIGSDSFSGNSIRDLIIPETLEYIPDGAFSDNKELWKGTLVIPKSVEFIGHRAFVHTLPRSNDEIITVRIPHSTSIISNSNFYNSFNNYVVIERY